jgi:hypothetical protein
VIVFGECRPLDEQELERKALRYGVEHARSGQPGHGLNAYATWLDALNTGRIQPNGSPRIARLLREAREAAPRFLQEIAGHFPQASDELAVASRQYSSVSEAWGEYVGQFMPPSAAALSDPAKQAAARRILEVAQTAERSAVEALERALPKLQTT